MERESVHEHIDTIKLTEFCYMYIESTNTVIYRPTHISNHVSVGSGTCTLQCTYLTHILQIKEGFHNRKAPPYYTCS